jgi:hypothetical protein
MSKVAFISGHRDVTIEEFEFRRYKVFSYR